MRIDALFGGALALFVLLVAAYALLRPGHTPPPPVDDMPPPQQVVAFDDPLCQCFDKGFRLAGSEVGVMSAQYRSGFELCSAQLGDEGGKAWTAGWNARLSSRPHEASCRAYLRGLL